MTVEPQGEVGREAIDSLGGYVYQIYRSALAWLDLSGAEFLYLEVAEDFAVAAENALTAVQVKETASKVTINSDDIVTTIDSFVTLVEKNPSLEIKMIHLTTSMITKEQSGSYRIGQTPLLDSWKSLSRAGDLTPIREILANSKLSEKTKKHIECLDDESFRKDFLQRIRFECGALDVDHVYRLVLGKLSELIIARGGVYSQSDNCLNNILIFLLKLSTQKENRKTDRAKLEELIEKATHISINKSVLEQRFLGSGLLAQAYGQGNVISADQQHTGHMHLVSKIALPLAIANRQGKLEEIILNVNSYGVAWVYGSAGVGKTLSAKLAARSLDGNWKLLNLRGLDREQVALKLAYAAELLSREHDGGLIVDDLDGLISPDVRDALLYLFFVCDNYRLPLIVTAFQSPSVEFINFLGGETEFSIHLSEFTKDDIEEMLNSKGVDHSSAWAKYLHLVSGGGHPQLAIAAIHSMERNNWDIEELKTLDSLLTGNSDIDHVRDATRQRLYQELPDQDKRLLERLSLKLGNFDRKLVLSIAEVEPHITDAGYILDRHTGAWIDLQADDVYSLSPLLSDLAEKNVSEGQKIKIHYAIANLILDERSLNPIEADYALLSAWKGRNTEVLIKLCLAVVSAHRGELEMIAPHMAMLRSFRTDQRVCEDNLIVEAIFRGAQLILITSSSGEQSQFSEALACFEKTVDLLSDESQRHSTRLMVLAKVLTSEAKFGAVPEFWVYLTKLQEWAGHLFPDAVDRELLSNEKNLSLVSFVFFNQIRQVKTIAQLESIFKYLDSCDPEFREKVFQPIVRDDFEVEQIFAGAWLSEHKANTIEPDLHEPIFSTLETYACSWKRKDMAVVARKYRAIIVDEYAEDKDKAISLLDEGMKIYGDGNYELIRAKAKIYYRSKDHKNSESLSRKIIESDAPLSATEKAFLGREAGISAEFQGDFAAARKYYLYGSGSAGACMGDDMKPMEIGLLADAAVAAWHDGDRPTCIRDMSRVLSRLQELEGHVSLRAAHCVGVSRHVVLWLLGQASGREIVIGDGEVTQVVPGIVSNPDPYEGIREFVDGRPMEMAWYMLAAVENYCVLDVGVTRGLENVLPSGPIVEGKLFLTSAVLHKAMSLLDADLFISSIIEALAERVYYKNLREETKVFNPLQPTYGDYPVPTEEEILEFQDFIRSYALVFAVRCVFESKFDEIAKLAEGLSCAEKLNLGDEFIDSLSSGKAVDDYQCSLATLVFKYFDSVSSKKVLPPSDSLLLLVKSLQIAHTVQSLYLLVRPAVKWYRMRWEYIWENQRFKLSLPRLHEQGISQTFTQSFESDIDELKSLILATVPTILGGRNESQVKEIIESISM